MARRIRPKTADGAADWLEKKTGVKRPLEPNVDLYEDQPLLLTDLLLPFFFKPSAAPSAVLGRMRRDIYLSMCNYKLFEEDFRVDHLLERVLDPGDIDQHLIGRILTI